MQRNKSQTISLEALPLFDSLGLEGMLTRADAVKVYHCVSGDGQNGVEPILLIEWPVTMLNFDWNGDDIGSCKQTFAANGTIFIFTFSKMGRKPVCNTDHIRVCFRLSMAVSVNGSKMGYRFATFAC